MKRTEWAISYPKIIIKDEQLIKSCQRIRAEAETVVDKLGTVKEEECVVVRRFANGKFVIMQKYSVRDQDYSVAVLRTDIADYLFYAVINPNNVEWFSEYHPGPWEKDLESLYREALEVVGAELEAERAELARRTTPTSY